MRKEDIAAVGIGAGLGLLAVRGWRRFRCVFLRGQHRPGRALLGYRCEDCGLALADLGEARTMDGGYTGWRHRRRSA